MSSKASNVSSSPHSRQPAARKPLASSAGKPKSSVLRMRPPRVNLDDPELYVNRELSLLAFQTRVLEEAQDESNPLLERVRFLSIVGSNLDEFFMVRVAGLMRQLEVGAPEVGPDALTPAEQLDAIRTAVGTLVNSAQRCFHSKLVPALERVGIRFVDYSELNGRQRGIVDKYFSDVIFPVLTPLALDPGRPFPHISNLSVNLAVVLEDTDGRQHFARLKLPQQLPSLITVPVTRKKGPQYKFVWIEQVVAANLESLFPGLRIVESHPFHITRDAEVAIKELESDDLLETVEEAVWRRRFRKPVRLQTDEGISEDILEILIENLGVTAEDVYRAPGPLDLTRLRQLPQLEIPELRDPTLEPWTPFEFTSQSDEDVFGVIRREDRFLHHPFQSFTPIVDVLRKAAHDPEVLAIKMTLYRVGRNSPIVKALLEAIENGKQVAVLLELKARFDEESNIEWARQLEREGVHVVYGLVGLKVHCKVALIVRREHDTIRRYLHLGTGNYNPVTARLYTDFSMFTTDADIGADATDLFNYLTGYSHKADFRKLLVAPVTLRKRLADLIRRETALGPKGRLIFKMNALEDKAMIRLLYEA